LEHTAHVHYIVSLEITQIKTRQIGTAVEHTSHVRHSVCIEVTQIKVCQT
jgi:hypothetical protein